MRIYDYTSVFQPGWAILVADNAYVSRYVNTDMGYQDIEICGQGGQITWCVVKHKGNDGEWYDYDRINIGLHERIHIRITAYRLVNVDTIPVKVLADRYMRMPDSWLRGDRR